jgi:predicted AAA+ superfamily ATPase
MQNMIPRIYLHQIQQMLSQFPAVGLLGPRQCGKTTLAKQIGGVYFDLESKGDYTRLDAEWDTLVTGQRLLILDEAHCVPEVFSRLRGVIDNDRKRNGRFLLLGSVSPALMKNVSESLAGRIGVVRMTPLILPELQSPQLDDLWFFGGYPDGGIQNPQAYPAWQTNYLDMLTMRDLPNWGLPSQPQQTSRLLSMLASLQGQPLLASHIGASLSLDHKTILRYCDFLEGAFLIRRLPAYSENIKKRIVKTPRAFWRDSGLLHAVMRIQNREHLYHQPWLGASWEGFVIEQTMAALSASGKRVDSYFFRTSDGYELDLVLDWGTEKWAIEIKLTSNPSSEMLSRLKKTAQMINAKKWFLITRIAAPFGDGQQNVTNVPAWLELIQKPIF